MPVFTEDQATMPDAVTALPTSNLSDGDLQRGLTSVTIANRGYGTFESIGMGAPLVATDLVDSVASSLSLGRIERGSINQGVLNAIGSPGLSQFYADNKDGIETGSGVAGLIGALFGGTALVKGLEYLGKARSAGWFSKALTLDSRYQSALASVRLAEMESAGLAKLGDSMIQASAAASKEATSLAALSGLRTGVVTEGLLAATMNQNDFLYSDSVGTNLAWSALGLGVGTRIEQIIAEKAIRKIASEQTVVRRFVDAFDPTGAEESKIFGFRRSQPAEVTAPAAGAFDDVTSLLVERETLRSGQGALDESQRDLLANNRESMANQLLGRAKEKLAIAVGKGIPGDGRTAIQFGSTHTAVSDAAHHVDYLMSQDPSAFMNLSHLGMIPDGMGIGNVADMFAERLTTRTAELQQALAKPGIGTQTQLKLTNQLRRIEQLKKATPIVFIDGERVGLAEGKIRAEYLTLPSPKIGDVGTKGESLFAVTPHGRKNALATIGGDLRLHIGGKKTIEQLDLFDTQRLFELGDHAAKRLAAKEGTIKLGVNPSWFELDLAEHIINLAKDPSKVQFPAGMTRESAQVESFAQKIEAIQKQAESKLSDPDIAKMRNRIKYNLPRQTSAQMGLSQTGDSIPELIAYTLAKTPGKSIRDYTIDQLRELMQGYQQIGGFTPDKNIRFKSFAGNSFTLGKDADGRKLAPLFGVMDPIDPHQWSLDHLSYRIGISRASTTAALSGQTADGFTQELMGIVLNSPETETALAVNALRDTQLTSAPGNFWGRAKNKFLTQDFIARDAPPITAMLALRGKLTQANNKLTSMLFTNALGDSLSQLANPRNRESKLLIDSFFSHAQGWDLNAPKQLDGVWKFTLGDTAGNRAKYLSMTGREMPANATLISPKGTDVVLDDLSMDIVNRWHTLTKARLDMANTVLRATGLREIAPRPYYVPTPRVKGEYVAFTFDSNGNQVVGKTARAKNTKDFAEQISALESTLQPGERIRRLDDIQQYGSVFDKAQLEFLDSGHATNAGKANKGGLLQQSVTIGAFEDALTALRSRFYQHTDDMMQVFAEDSIAGAKARAAAAVETRPVNAGIGGGGVPQGVYQRWLDAALGHQRIDSNDSVMGQILRGAEGAIDRLLATVPTKTKVDSALTAWLGRPMPFSKTAAAKSDFESLTQALGKYMPIEDHAEWLRINGYGDSPYTAKGVQQKLSGFTAALQLRVMDAATSVMTMGSLFANMPAVMRQLQRLPEESLEAWQHRNRQFGTIINLGENQGLGLLDMTKITKSAIEALFDPSFAHVLDAFHQRGMASQEVAELTKQMAVLTPRSGLAKKFLGDNSIASPKTIGEKIKAKGMVGSLSILTDSAENFSRLFSSTVGYKLAENMGVNGHEARLNFAHYVANQIIADYNPLNRPDIFQGPLGGTVGLFRTFIQNYYQRLYGYAETANWKPLVNQYVAQGALFGLPSVPGWAALDKMGEFANDDKMTATDRIATNAGAFHDLAVGGAISTLPKLFGLDATSIYTRGDTNMRIPSPEHLAGDISPAYSTIAKMVGGLIQAVQLAWPGGQPLTTQRMGEILSNMVVNRGLGGLIEVAAAGGYDTDAGGKTVSVATTMAEKAYRILGMKSMAQEEQTRAYYRSKPWLEQQSALQSDLRQSVRAAIRSGDFESLLPMFQNKYLENGGDVKYFRRFISESFDSAKHTASQSALKRALNKDEDSADVMRYLGAGVELPEDQQEKDQTLSLLNSMSDLGEDEPTQDEADSSQLLMQDPSTTVGTTPVL